MSRFVVPIALLVASAGIGCVPPLPGTDLTGSGGGGGQSGAGGPAMGGTAGIVSLPGTDASAIDAAVAFKFSDTFDQDTQFWTLSNYVDSPYYNWGSASVPPPGSESTARPTLMWSGHDGDPDPGSLQVAVTFTGVLQYIDPQVNVWSPQTAPIDLSGRVVQARIRLVEGTFPAGGVQFHLSSNQTGPDAYAYVATFVPASMLTPGDWITISLDTRTATPSDGRHFDASQVVQIGVQFNTGPDSADGGAPTFGAVVFEIDSVQG